MFHVRGGDGGIPVMLEFARTLGFRLLDCSTGEFLTDDASNAAFSQWHDLPRSDREPNPAGLGVSASGSVGIAALGVGRDG